MNQNFQLLQKNSGFPNFSKKKKKKNKRPKFSKKKKRKKEGNFQKRP